MNAMRRFRHDRAMVLLLTTIPVTCQPVLTVAQERGRDDVLEEVIVIAPYGTLLPRDLVPASVQSATAEQIERSQSLDLADFLTRNFGSVSVNHAQNNPLQPDVNFRGFTASPLLGLAPGLTVYENGVRINEPFGDTVNWDLIPLSAIGNVQLMAGANPVFGLNTLGGALSLRMKNGFDYEQSGVEAYAGSFARRAATLQSGGNDGRWGYYVNADYFQEDGWRDHSNSDALRFFGALSHRSADSTLDLSVARAQTELRGNGTTPVELLAIDRSQVFTWPDVTENTLTQAILEGSRKLSDALSISGNAYYRDIGTDTFNGDGTFFEECDIDDEELLVEEDFTDVNGDGECSAADDTDIEPVLDRAGEPIEAELDDEELNAVNNLGRRRQEAYGASLQLAVHSSIGGRDNDLTLGVAYSEGRTRFNSEVEVARLLDDRSTSRTDIFAAGFATAVESELTTRSVYFVDTLNVTDQLALTLAGRYDKTRIRLSDHSGQSPELNGSHEFHRFNPALGATYRLTPAVQLYASYSQSARAPTPVELACASEDAPCNLPNAFLADPPLEQVVATSIEGGLRGSPGRGLRWDLGAFHTVNDDDILFQTTGGPQANVGFFDNIGDTRRAGIELGLSQRLARWDWFFDYSFIDATYEDAFIVNSPSHPVFEDDPGASQIVGAEKLQVASGASIPGIPRHQVNVGADLRFNDRLSVGSDVEWRSGVHLRGDEANLMNRTDSYFVLNLRGEYRFGERMVLFARLENVLDEEYETFGLLGEPQEVFPDFEDPRFLGAGPPFGAWIGIRIEL
jgi:iron complex outermembrane recepter protein